MTLICLLHKLLLLALNTFTNLFLCIHADSQGLQNTSNGYNLNLKIAFFYLQGMFLASFRIPVLHVILFIVESC